MKLWYKLEAHLSLYCPLGYFHAMFMFMQICSFWEKFLYSNTQDTMSNNFLWWWPSWIFLSTKKWKKFAKIIQGLIDMQFSFKQESNFWEKLLVYFLIGSYATTCSFSCAHHRFQIKKNVSIGHGHSNLTCAFWSQTLWNKFQMICIKQNFSYWTETWEISTFHKSRGITLKQN